MSKKVYDLDKGCIVDEKPKLGKIVVLAVVLIEAAKQARKTAIGG